MSYCAFCKTKENDNVHVVYHNTLYGFPIYDDDELFGRLILEINQAGLSWNTILNKQENFRKAFDDYNIEKIANYNDKKIAELLDNAGIIRNKLKIHAVIHNAKTVLEIRKKSGTFKCWLDDNHPLTKDEWVKLFKTSFKFVGGEIINEFLMSTGYLKGAHDEDCPVYDKIIKLNPKWIEKK